VLERIETIHALRECLWRRSPTGEGGLSRHSPMGGGGSRALVPTMGALHGGHAALIDAARRESGVVVVSIFVNPLQFNSQDDLARYPRTLDADAALCLDHGADILFAPSAQEVYPEPPECTVDVGHLADHLCGKFRPGHFRGVATVVLKFLQMVQPDRAYFGEKDAQQLAIIRRLVGDFNLPIDVVEVPTVREADGLAMSSRNRHLSAEERRLAPSLYEALDDARRRILAGERDGRAIREAAAARIQQSHQHTASGPSRTANVRLEYLEIVDPATLQPVDDVDRPVRVAGALWIGSTRLIDNVLVER
jgi:pantoate--beta-alanine ligase